MSKLADILFTIQKKSGMWFGRQGTIRDISAFITGFQHGQTSPPDSLSFEYFTRWVAAHYRVVDGAMNSFALILEQVDGDEHRAFDEFFRLLPLYVRDMTELGGAGVHAHYGKVMKEISVNTKLLNIFLSEDGDAGTCQKLLNAILEQRMAGAPLIREFNFNRFTVVLDFEKNQVALRDDLLLEPESEGHFTLKEFEKALQGAIERKRR